MWSALPSRFADALFRERFDGANLDDVITPATKSGLNIYWNNFLARLTDALAGRFPAIQRIVGDEFFYVMVRAYVLRDPPRSPVLIHYGGAFAEFIDGFSPAATLSYLADVARLEDAHMRAYYAADRPSVGPHDFCEIESRRLEELIFEFSPAAALIRSKHPIVTIWAMNVGNAELAPIQDWVGEAALVYRRNEQVGIKKLAPDVASFLQMLIDGASLGDAALLAMSQATNFHLTDALATIIGAGVIADIRNRNGGS
jgi:hypothetical protein